MKSNNSDRIFLYLSGRMSEGERREFESQLNESASLKEELDGYLRIMKEIKDLGNVKVSEQYFVNLVPRVREKLESKKRPKLIPKLAYILPILVVIAVLIMKPFGSNNNLNQNTGNFELNNIVAGLDDDTKSEIINNLAEREDINSPQAVLVSDAIDNEVLEKKMTDELFKTDEAKVNFLSNDDIESNLSQEETQKIYKTLLDKKIL